jgi:hypothetical protein
MAGRFSPVAARPGRLEQQQGVGASSLEMLTGASGGTILGAGTGGVVEVSALPSEYLRCFSQPHLLSFLVVFSYLAVSGFCIVFLKFHVSYFLK